MRKAAYGFINVNPKRYITGFLAKHFAQGAFLTCALMFIEKSITLAWLGFGVELLSIIIMSNHTRIRN